MADFKDGDRVRHVTRGSFYTVLGIGHLQVSSRPHANEGDPLIVYRGDDGQLWCRPASEFGDGRFEHALTPPPEPAQDREALARDWVNCPICGEPDMRKTTDQDGHSLIYCVNHNCASNGGSNAAGFKRGR